MARRRARGRDVSGILLLDKPAGITSNLTLQKVKRLFNANKGGHTGSLDPFATGLLPVCFGEATKVSSYLLDSNKGYDVTVKLGQRTDSGDIDGEVVETRPVPDISETELKEILQRFVGEIDQVPPMHSALKVDGQPLYKLAHQGKEIERKARRITIYSIELTGQSGDEICLSVQCSKGTYIRVLAQDIGEAIGCGAHVSVLRRTHVAGFELAAALPLDELGQIKDDEGFEALDARLLAVDAALQDWPGVSLSEDMVFFVLRGQAVLVPKAPTDGLVKLYGAEDKFLGIGHILEDGRVAPKRLMSL